MSDEKREKNKNLILYDKSKTSDGNTFIGKNTVRAGENASGELDSSTAVYFCCKIIKQKAEKKKNEIRVNVSETIL